jgi:5-methylcytosine-specific restriction endonuclease McrBC GTP-binding regulatory subunit McrB
MSKIDAIFKKVVVEDLTKKTFENPSKPLSAKSPKVTPENKIYFGAPGTGKSYQITQDLKEVDLIFQKRVTFHPEYDNASFVGGYKPITDNNGDIKYEFAPQIFTNIFVEACNDPSHQYYLIIEEINRGNCAEIFGELFQLLDRNKDYKITPSNELINYLNTNISNSKFYIEGKMLLPDNLSILATMNTSDQSLFPMDSAFKRRWEWEYIPINYSTDTSVNKSALYKIKIGDDLIDWITFIAAINKRIQSNKNLGMDKCIGNYFIEPDSSNYITLDKFIYKVLFYLWNDVFKDEPKDSIFGDKSYQDFFPIETMGKQLVIKILEDLKITTPKLLVGETKTED